MTTQESNASSTVAADSSAPGVLRSFLRPKRRLALLAAVILMLFLFRPGLYRLRNRIAISIGSALGRRVALDNVHLRFLPRPGFDLEGLTIYDDPAFSEEPMIHAQEVSAAIRLRSLFRGRIEIATLSASDPSINLVRNDEGRWNLATLLERNAQIPAAPTGKPASERRPAFPYLEATNARINFKIRQTKKSYALVNSDVALWQDSENSWGARIKADPIRTDFNLTDTGSLQLNAVWQRAASLRSTPFQITAQWRNGQLGQITKLLSGKDRGWRGEVGIAANLSGTPEALQIDSQTIIEGFHRYDIVGSESLRIATGCSGLYSATAGTVTSLLCESPVGTGTVELRGSLAVVAQHPVYDLTLEAEKVPVASMLRLLRQAKRQIPADLTATGLLNAEFRATRNPGAFSARAKNSSERRATQTWSGSGVATKVRISSNSGASGKNGDKDDVTLGDIPLALIAAEPSVSFASPALSAEQHSDRPLPENRLRIGPIAMKVGAAEPVNAGGWVSSAGYRFSLRGDLELKDLFRLETVLGLPVTRPAADGSATVDVSISGPWQGFAPAVTGGTAQLRNVHAEMHSMNMPIEIASATMTLTPDALLMEKISAHTGATHWSGTVTAIRHCAAGNRTSGQAAPVYTTFFPLCPIQFDLTADQFSTSDLAEWFTPHPKKRPWYRILSPDEPKGRSPLLGVQAQGNLRVGRLLFNKLAVTQVTSQVEVQRGVITLGLLRGQLLEGHHLGHWTINTLLQPVSFQGSGTLQDISLSQLSTLMDNAWITGTADGKFDLQGSGDNISTLAAHSDGQLQFVMRNGTLAHIEIPGSHTPLPVHRFAGELRLKNNVWELESGRLESRDGLYQVSGTASPGSGFDFRLTRGDQQSWVVKGPLAKPRVASRDQNEGRPTEAAAKTDKP